MESSEQTEARAAAWLAKRDSGDWCEEDQRQLDAWLATSTHNEVAFIRLEAVWDQALRMKALAAGTPSGEVPPPGAWDPSPLINAQSSVDGHEATAYPARDGKAPARRRVWLMGALAATVILAVAASIALYLELGGTTYRTTVGGIQSVPMRDGSRITLNTDSKISLALSESERRVDLEQGEAFFEVAKDPARPFVVHAGSKRVIAVGTQFSVRRLDDDVRVFVTEGKVRVESDSPAADVRVVTSSNVETSSPVQPDSAGRGPEILVTAGGIARTSGAGVLVQDRQLSQVEDYLSWRRGYLVFREATLADAVAEFNRYNERQIVVEDSSVAAIRLSGKFQATQFDAFVRLLEEGFPIRARAEGERIVLTNRQAH